MKYLSGDFLSEYNRALKELQKEQKVVDDKWAKIISDLVEEEVERLEDTVPVTFEIGQKVLDSNGNIGTVESTQVVLNVHEDEDYHGKKHGPNKFFAIENEQDEEAVTCEGMLRMINVEFETSVIEKDWGYDTKTVSCYEDELEKLDD
ncbi:MAG: hypothetical protein CMO97_05115 [Woeseia sp.]|nr:hypothetical protein [Woeseia sp.]